jgi:hypothetical protein
MHLIICTTGSPVSHGSFSASAAAIERAEEFADSDMTDLKIPEHEDFRQWLQAICVIGFDIERGQVVEHVFPFPDAVTPDDQKSIAYLAFPDHNADCMGDTLYQFRFKSSSEQFLFGFVCFRQVADPTSRRGFFQKVWIQNTKLFNLSG